MGGFFGSISTKPCVNDLFYGTDYHSHLGTKRAGMVTLTPNPVSTAQSTVSNAIISALNLKTSSTASSAIRDSESSATPTLSR